MLCRIRNFKAGFYASEMVLYPREDIKIMRCRMNKTSNFKNILLYQQQVATGAISLPILIL